MKRKRYLKKTTLEEARRLIAGRLDDGWSSGYEEVPAAEAAGRILAVPPVAVFSCPAYHASAMDGYAVEARLTFGARENEPVDLRAGVVAVPVDTGDPLPEGANAVIMVEDVHFEGDFIRIYRSFSPYENVRLMGEDVVAGEILLPAGKVITPFDIGICLAGGQTRLKVRRRPRVGIIPTGDELISPGRAPARGDIVEFNTAVLAAMARERGGEPKIWPIIPDEVKKVREAVGEALREMDIVVINAGSSAGRDDYTAGIIADMGEVLAHGISIMPGKPTVLGLIENRPVIGLPGYPASAVVSFEQFVLPLIDRFTGWEKPEDRIWAHLSRDLPSRPGHVEFIRGQAGEVGDRMVFNPLPRGASLMSSYARANAVAEIPAASEGVERGEEISIRPLVDRLEVDRSIILTGSHDLCLEIMREELLCPPGRINLLVSTQGSLGGLILLQEGYSHLATCHLLDPETGLYNRPYIDRFLPGRKIRLLHVAEREQGLMVKAGNPGGIGGLADLAREDIVYVNRQRGSGTRILLDHLLGGEGISPDDIRGYEREEINHLTVAAAVSGGLADAGMGILSAAAALGLDFIPLAKEVFDIVIPQEIFEIEPVVRLRNIVGSDSFRRRLEALGGYDTGISGSVD